MLNFYLNFFTYLIFYRCMLVYLFAFLIPFTLCTSHISNLLLTVTVYTNFIHFFFFSHSIFFSSYSFHFVQFFKRSEWNGIHWIFFQFFFLYRSKLCSFALCWKKYSQHCMHNNAHFTCNHVRYQLATLFCELAQRHGI